MDKKSKLFEQNELDAETVKAIRELYQLFETPEMQKVIDESIDKAMCMIYALAEPLRELAEAEKDMAFPLHSKKYFKRENNRKRRRKQRGR